VTFFLRDVLHIPRGTYFYNYGTVFATFFLSGVMHAYAAYFAGAMTLSTPAMIDAMMQNMKFFMLQACGIWLEENVAIALRAVGLLGPKTPKGEAPVMWKRLLGYAWTALWLGWTTRAWLNSNIKCGMFVEEESPLAVSLGRELWTRLGVIEPREEPASFDMPPMPPMEPMFNDMFGTAA
jgi:hypothetical protein